MDEELTVRQVPYSLEAEQAVLGSILIDSRCITDVVGTVKPDHLCHVQFLPDHRPGDCAG